MTTLQKTFEEVLQDAPYRAVAAIISERLAAQGVVLTARERERLTIHLKADTIGSFRFRRWRWWENRNLTIDITEADTEAIHTGFDEFLEEGLSGFVTDAVDELSPNILKALHRGWQSELRQQNRDREGFEKRLGQRWGQATNLLRMLRVVSLELGESVNTTLQQEPDFACPYLLDVLTRLHARACQVTDEIVCLLDSGFADGAMARWRTLHEIAIVAFFVKEHGEVLAKRYVDHQIVESFRAACDYRECSERMGYEPLTDAEFDEIHHAYESLVAQYGPTFKLQYGWAADALGHGRPTLRDIEKSAGIDHLRAHYRMASHNVHANPKGVFFKLGSFENSDILLAGPSNAGLADPGHSAAISLMQVTVALAMIEPTIDSLVGLRILASLEDEVGEAFIEAHRRLEEDSE